MSMRPTLPTQPAIVNNCVWCRLSRNRSTLYILGLDNQLSQLVKFDLDIGGRRSTLAGEP